jgi:hypothetical protein
VVNESELFENSLLVERERKEADQRLMVKRSVLGEEGWRASKFLVWRIIGSMVSLVVVISAVRAEPLRSQLVVGCVALVLVVVAGPLLVGGVGRRARRRQIDFEQDCIVREYQRQMAVLRSFQRP